jgi:hypothetical protein
VVHYNIADLEPNWGDYRDRVPLKCQGLRPTRCIASSVKENLPVSHLITDIRSIFETLSFRKKKLTMFKIILHVTLNHHRQIYLHQSWRLLITLSVYIKGKAILVRGSEGP